MNALGRWLALVVLGPAIGWCAAAPAATAQEYPVQESAEPAQAAETPPAASAAFSPAQLEQLVAPIALYPDSLLSQVLMAATYPLEIVEAQRWLEANQGLAGEALEEALKAHDWDPSVKSLCGFPPTLELLSEHLDWTRDLGDAFLRQQAELMDAVQRMRRIALEAGQLESTEEQTVEQEGDVIVVEPAQPDVVYVPSYSPVVVYPGWYYPHWYYPWFFVPPPPGHGFIHFGVGFFWGFALFGACDWHHHVVHVHTHHFHDFDRRTSHHPSETWQPGAGELQPWTHDPEHRRGVRYRSQEVARRFGAQSGSRRVSREEARGFAGPGAARGAAREEAAAQAPAGAEERGRAVAPAGGREAGRVPATAPTEGERAGRERAESGRARSRPVPPAPRVAPRTGEREPRSQASGDRPPPTVRRPAPAPHRSMGGIRRPGFDRSASQRGAASRGMERSRGARRVP
jgi:hypothetical protein